MYKITYKERASTIISNCIHKMCDIFCICMGRYIAELGTNITNNTYSKLTFKEQDKY